MPLASLILYGWVVRALGRAWVCFGPSGQTEMVFSPQGQPHPSRTPVTLPAAHSLCFSQMSACLFFGEALWGPLSFRPFSKWSLLPKNSSWSLVLS